MSWFSLMYFIIFPLFFFYRKKNNRSLTLLLVEVTAVAFLQTFKYVLTTNFTPVITYKIQP